MLHHWKYCITSYLCAELAGLDDGSTKSILKRGARRWLRCYAVRFQDRLLLLLPLMLAAAAFSLFDSPQGRIRYSQI
jgi:hypothetical protein